jgi:hypothetical protein
MFTVLSQKYSVYLKKYGEVLSKKLLLFYLFYRKIKYERLDWIGFLFSFFVYLE